MDLAYLRAHPQHLPTFLTHQRIRETPVSGGDICAAARLTLDDGSSLFTKTWPDAGGTDASRTAPEGFFATEAAGLDWLRSAGAVPVPEVIVALPGLLALEWIEPGSATPEAAARLGRELAALHRAGSSAFGADWPGFIGRLPQDNTPSADPWPVWFAEHRLAPYLRLSADNGALTATEVALVERVIAQIDQYGGAEPPARIHGDLWPGNVLWATDGRAWLVDPAAHGGHRETDLAQLALFGGAPHLDRLLAAYQEVWPLAEGWSVRVSVHQLHLLLVHTASFGSSYREAVRATATSALQV
ncbi:fructosamine kinase family protein [Micromonospora polyrhachis]|uniref:Fructosamine-3-kinase n=1 Tax=Micromonospora polyrhachis TaxID=1282883 RepID=A0A7W7SST0_9ACTN|nr:fructosamine kinase family protein [Micromonospora polyrhachis]MBB4959055.1 fructosamine-3-kinase [Micromonospora polyrhachis]